MSRHTEDNHSNTSGETNASDSGRGGSEMDINSSGPLSQSPDNNNTGKYTCNSLFWGDILIYIKICSRQLYGDNMK